MNNKGQEAMGVGLFIGIFITVLVGIVLMLGSAQNLDEATNTEALLYDASLAVVANSTAQSITDWKSLTDVTVYNQTGGGVIDSSYYTITNDVVEDAALIVNFTPSAAIFENYTNAWLINATGQRVGYIKEGGARSIAGLIIIFFALAIAMVALIPTLRNKIVDSI